MAKLPLSKEQIAREAARRAREVREQHKHRIEALRAVTAQVREANQQLRGALAARWIRPLDS